MTTDAFDIHEGGQLRLTTAGEQVSLLPIPDAVAPMSWDEMYAILARNLGQYVRVTVRNGAGRDVAHPTGIVGTWSDYLTIGGHLVGGEYSNAVKIEIRGENGRYASV